MNEFHLHALVINGSNFFPPLLQLCVNGVSIASHTFAMVYVTWMCLCLVHSIRPLHSDSIKVRLLQKCEEE